MLLGKAFYFLFFGAAVCLVPFLSLYYQGLGLPGREIGFLIGIVPLVNMVGSSIWGMLSDATGRHRVLFVSAIIGTWLSVFGMSRADTFLTLIPVVLLYAFFSAPIVPLVDNSVMDWVKEADGDYGRIRVWGSYGWAIGGAVTGVLIERSGIMWAFYLYLIIMALLLFVAVPFPMSSSSVGSKFWGALGTLLSDRAWLLFLGVALVEGMALGTFLNYVFPFAETLGFSRSVMGYSLTVATLSEVPIFLGSKKMLDRWGSLVLLAVSLFFTVLRAFTLAAMSAPWHLLVISVLNGPTFSLMWVAGVAYANRIAPPGMGATAQGVFNGLVMGLGLALGAFAGGAIYDAFSPAAVFIAAGLASLLALLVFVGVNRQAFLAKMRPASIS